MEYTHTHGSTQSCIQTCVHTRAVTQQACPETHALGDKAIDCLRTKSYINGIEFKLKVCRCVSQIYDKYFNLIASLSFGPLAIVYGRRRQRMTDEAD